MICAARTLVRSRPLASHARALSSAPVSPAERLKAYFQKLFIFSPNEKGTTTDYVNATRSQNGGYGAGYRYPAPGSRPTANIPEHASDDSLYDTSHYTRNTAKWPMPKVTLQAGTQVALAGEAAKHAALTAAHGDEAAMLAAEVEVNRGSPGNKNPGIMRYDPSGLRSAMSTTNEETDKAIAANLPDHLSTPWWSKGYPSGVEGVTVQGALLSQLEAKGLPPQPGFKSQHTLTRGTIDGKW